MLIHTKSFGILENCSRYFAVEQIPEHQLRGPGFLKVGVEESLEETAVNGDISGFKSIYHLRGKGQFKGHI